MISKTKVTATPLAALSEDADTARMSLFDANTSEGIHRRYRRGWSRSAGNIPAALAIQRSAEVCLLPVDRGSGLHDEGAAAGYRRHHVGALPFRPPRRFGTLTTGDAGHRLHGGLGAEPVEANL